MSAPKIPQTHWQCAYCRAWYHSPDSRTLCPNCACERASRNADEAARKKMAVRMVAAIDRSPVEWTGKVSKQEAQNRICDGLRVKLEEIKLLIDGIVQYPVEDE